MSSCVRTQKTRNRQTTVILISTLIIAITGCHGRAKNTWQGRKVNGPVRAIWVTRWDYKSPRDIAIVMENCKAAGFNTVLFQVRGAGTAMYPSRLEPWADELGGRDPGFDPLAVACQEGHRRGLSVHAWVNVIPGWHGDKPPTNPRQLYNARPEWFWHDTAGRRQPLGWYSSVNPCYPEVRRYLVDVMNEVVSRYPVDGLHMDYIRFPNEWSKAYPEGATVPDYPRDSRTLSLFRQATGKTPEQAPGAWNTWRADQVTQLVREIRRTILKTDGKVSLTAAVGADAEIALRTHFQDSRRWIKEGLVDAVFPMNYESDMGGYGARLAKWAPQQSRVPVVTGVMFDKRSGSLVVDQVNAASQSGSHFAAFAYNSLFERLDGGGRPKMDGQSPSRAALRQQVIPYLRRLAS